MLIVEEDEFHAEVQRILHSDELRNSEMLRRLLAFLAEKTSTGEAWHLKEYTVAIDGLGKPPSYDPRHNSTVRIQVARLRQKLAEYYRNDGKHDPVVIDVPKGQFGLTCQPRPALPESLGPVPVSPPLIEPPLSGPATALSQAVTPPRKRRLIHFLPWFITAVALAVATVALINLRTLSKQSNSASPFWSSELDEIWSPILRSSRPVILAIEDPLFVELRSEPGIYYRDKSLNTWRDVLASPDVTKLRSAMGPANLKPSRYYTAFGEVNAAFFLGRLLGPRERNLTVVKTSQLTWQQMADNNVLFVGVQNLFFEEQLQGMPLKLKLIPVERGIENIDPQVGEPSIFNDQFSTAPSEEGVVYALATHVEGPLGDSDVVSFTSNRAAGYVAAVQWFTDPHLAVILKARLRAASAGKLPRYYQVLLRVKFKDEVPLETTYITSRELR